MGFDLRWCSFASGTGGGGIAIALGDGRRGRVVLICSSPSSAFASTSILELPSFTISRSKSSPELRLGRLRCPIIGSLIKTDGRLSTSLVDLLKFSFSLPLLLFILALAIRPLVAAVARFFPKPRRDSSTLTFSETPLRAIRN